MPYYEGKRYVVVVFAIDNDDPDLVEFSRSDVVDAHDVPNEARWCSIDASDKLEKAKQILAK